jgi:uncharacterized protein (DUF885 family)
VAYMLGGLQLRALHEELVTKGKMSDREFHDRVLREGPIPIEVLRAVMKGEKLEKGYTPRWRFAD